MFATFKRTLSLLCRVFYFVNTNYTILMILINISEYKLLLDVNFVFYFFLKKGGQNHDEKRNFNNGHSGRFISIRVFYWEIDCNNFLIIIPQTHRKVCLIKSSQVTFFNGPVFYFKIINVLCISYYLY